MSWPHGAKRWTIEEIAADAVQARILKKRLTGSDRSFNHTIFASGK